MIKRALTRHARDLATRYPVLTVTGPRQAGKTTLCRAAFPNLPYINLEDPNIRAYALADPNGMVAQYAEGAIFDELQRAPELASAIQVRVDEARRPGMFVLTGSQHLGVRGAVTQSLAGRTAMLELLPADLPELLAFKERDAALWPTIFTGGYLPIYDRGHTPTEWCADYVRTCIERDVPQVLGVQDLLAFGTFLRLCAGLSGRLLNLSSLGADAGVTHNTAKAWLSVLEALYIVIRLPPLHASVRKRLIKTPKLHFVDTGLLCYLLGIRSPDELFSHPLRGAIFETWVVSEVRKAFLHHGLRPDFSFYRDRQGLEVDLVVRMAGRTIAIECKSGATLAGDATHALQRLDTLLRDRTDTGVDTSLAVYGGDEPQRRGAVHVVDWASAGPAVREAATRQN